MQVKKHFKSPSPHSGKLKTIEIIMQRCPFVQGSNYLSHSNQTNKA